MTRLDVSGLRRESDWTPVRATVAGLGVAGFAAADALLRLGARVAVLDAADGPGQQQRAAVLQTLGAHVRLGAAAPADDPQAAAGLLTRPPAGPSSGPSSGRVDDGPGPDLLVVSPGLRPADPLIVAAQRLGVPVWGELELAWRLRSADAAAPWLCVTGTNGKTTTTLMLESMLRAAGRRTVAAGNIGTSLVDTVMTDARRLDVIAVEVGAPQLPFWYSPRPQAAVCLNLAPDHVDHFGSVEAYAAAKARIYQRTQVAAVYNQADPATRAMVQRADVREGCRAIGFTTGPPGVGMLGVVDDLLVDRAFLAERATHAVPLAQVSDVRPAAPHNVANALAAAALARAHGVPPAAVGRGLRAFRPARHRIADVGEVAGVRYVDDSKATNAHAAQTSLLAYPSVVWVAGGQAKGQRFDDLVRAVRDRLRGVVLLGVDRDLLADALARHAPEVPVVAVARTDTGAMTDVVRAAAALARPGDTVLLAPGCASWDMFRDYGHRGEVFAAAVADLAGDAG